MSDTGMIFVLFLTISLSACQARNASVSVEDVASALATPGSGNLTAGGSSALQAANAVYGATAASLTKAGTVSAASSAALLHTFRK